MCIRDRGSGDKSYGIQVAKMAGLPSSVIARAKQILIQKFENNDQLTDNLNNHDLMNPIDKIENEEMIKLKGEIENLNINDITPVEALSILNEIKNKYNI